MKATLGLHGMGNKKAFLSLSSQHRVGKSDILNLQDHLDVHFKLGVITWTKKR